MWPGRLREDDPATFRTPILELCQAERVAVEGDGLVGVLDGQRNSQLDNIRPLGYLRRATKFGNPRHIESRRY